MPGLGRAAWRAFWHGLRVPQLRLDLFRVAFFSVLGLESVLRMDAVPRHGASEFSVAHLAILDALPVPGRELMGVVYLLQGYLAFRAAAGAAGRGSLALLGLLYGGAYFASLLDGFQHHYLVFLVLVLCGFARWRPGEGELRREAPDDWPVASGPCWPVRLILVQVSLVYAFAAVAKLDAAWWSGATLRSLLELPEPAPAAGLLEWLGLATAARLVVAAELFLALAIQVERLRAVATLAGVALHLGLELGLGFSIGLFSYYMLGFYLLVAPEAWLRAAWRAAAPLRQKWAARPRPGLGAGASRALDAAFLAGGAALLLTLRLPFQAAVAAGALGLGALARRPAAHLAACAALALSVAASGAAVGYYESLGGILGTLGRTDEAIEAHRRLVALRSDRAADHAYLGLLLMRAEREPEALAALAEAQRLDPRDVRAFVLEARIHHEAGRGREALESAGRILEIDPEQPFAIGLRAHWSGSRR